MGKTRIAFFVDVFKEHFDGVSNTMHQIIRRIPKEEFEVIIITPHPPDGEVEFPVHRCPYIHLPVQKAYRVAMPRFDRRLKGILDEFSPHVIHCTSPSLLGKFAVRYAGKRGLPVTTIYHTHFPTYGQYYFRFLPFSGKIMNLLLKLYFRFYHYTDAIFAPTRSMNDYLVASGIAPGKLRIWGRGVDMTRFNAKFRNERLFEAWGKKIKKILFVSRLVKEKETDTLIRLYELIEEAGDPIKLIITGDGPDRERMQKHMARAIFTGMKKDEELAEIYASCDVFVFPSVTETFGNVVLEALASGLPVVAADAGGPSDIVENEVSGLLVEPRNEKAFYDAIRRLLDDEAFYLKMRDNAITYAMKQSWRSLCGDLFETYKTLRRQAESCRS